MNNIIYGTILKYIIEETTKILENKYINKFLDICSWILFAIIGFYFSKYIGEAFYQILNITYTNGLDIAFGFIFINILFIFTNLKIKGII